MADIFEIAGRIHSTSQEGVATVASEILDETQNKKQSEVNTDVARHENEIHGTGGIDSRLSDVEQLAEISIGGGDAQIATGADFTNPDATKRAKVPTVGAIVDGLNDGVYDVSKRFPTGGSNSDGKFTLEYILNNADTLIPTGWRHGGMTISFVDSSDNKYVQYRLMSDTFNTTVANWQGVDDEPTAGSDNLVKSGGITDMYGTYINNPEFLAVWLDKDNKILFGIQADGNFIFGAGVPTQIQEFVLQVKESIIELINGKVDKVVGKELINSDFAECISALENHEFFQVETDVNHKILGGRKSDGTKLENMPFETPSFISFHLDNKEWVMTLTDSNNKIIAGIKKDGKLYADIYGIDREWISQLKEDIEALKITPSVKDMLFAGVKEIGVIGDSLASGATYNPDTERTSDHPEYSWYKVLERDSGNSYVKLCAGGMSARSFARNSHSSHIGLSTALQQENKCQLYILALGANDRNIYAQDHSYLGSSADIDMANPDNNPDTFYGNYGYIIQKITQAFPNAKFILFTEPRINGVINEAIRDISIMFDNCFLCDLWDMYSYLFVTNGYYYQFKDRTNHYPAMAYMSMGKLFEKAISKTIQEHLDVFKYIQIYE